MTKPREHCFLACACLPVGRELATLKQSSAQKPVFSVFRLHCNMNIIFDARMMGPQQRGIGRYIDQLLAPMMENSGYEWWILVREVPATTPPAVHWVKELSRWYSVREQWAVPWKILKIGGDVIHVPHFNVPVIVSILSYLGIVPPFVITIHDLQLIRSPHTQPTTLPKSLWWIKYGAFRIGFWFAAACARRIIAVSDATAEDLRKFLPKRLHGRIITIPEAVSRLPVHRCSVPENLSDPGQVPAASGTPHAAVARMTGSCPQHRDRPFVLTVGSTYPHKRLALVYEALAQLGSDGMIIDWVHVGPTEVLSERFFQGLQQQEAARSGDSSWVQPIGYQSDDALAGWYYHSLAFLYPSQVGSEGYGLPVEEALACGAFVITTPVPSLKGKNLESCPQLVMIEESGKLLETVVEQLKKRFAHPQPCVPWEFSDHGWQANAQQTLRVYRDVIS